MANNGAPLPAGPAVTRGMPQAWQYLLGFVLSVVIGILLYIASRGYLTPQGSGALAVTGFAITMWLTRVLPVEITSILVCVLFVFFHIVPPAISFSGFANPSVWFVFAALIFGVAIHESGIGRRMALNIMRFTGTSFTLSMVGILITGFVLSLVTPAGVERVIILYSIVIGLASGFGLTDEEFRNSNTGKLSMGIVYLAGNAFGYGILTALAPNVVAEGIVKQLLGVQVTWVQWITWFGLPVALTTVITAILLFKIFKPEVSHLQEGKSYVTNELKALGKITGREKRAALYLLIALILWVTNGITHLAPWAVAVFVAALFVAPGIGVIDTEHLKRLPVSVVIFTGAVLSVGVTLLHTGVATWLGKLLLGGVISTGMSMPKMGMLTFLMSGAAHIPLIEGMTMISALLPVVIHFFNSMGIHSLGPALLTVMASDNISFFPPMQLPMLLLVGLGYLKYKDSIIILCLFSVVGIAINVLASVTWYHWLGLL